MKNRLLVRINALSEVSKYQKEGINTFLFPLQDFSIGYNVFDINELKNINADIYLLLNRVLDNDSCDKLRELKNKLSFVKGILFEDIAVYQIFKDTKIDLIWNQSHFAVSYHSINSWLSRVSSVVISNELEKSELNIVLDNSTKKVILPVLGLNMAMYSRRYLLTYYNEHISLNDVKEGVLKTNNNIDFLAKENQYGTVLFYHKYYNLIPYLNEIHNDNVLFYYIDPNELSAEDVLDILNGKEIDYDNRFYNNKTVYRIGDLNA